jgi:hypothetical protein
VKGYELPQSVLRAPQPPPARLSRHASCSTVKAPLAWLWVCRTTQVIILGEYSGKDTVTSRNHLSTAVGPTLLLLVARGIQQPLGGDLHRVQILRVTSCSTRPSWGGWCASKDDSPGSLDGREAHSSHFEALDQPGRLGEHEARNCLVGRKPPCADEEKQVCGGIGSGECSHAGGWCPLVWGAGIVRCLCSSSYRIIVLLPLFLVVQKADSSPGGSDPTVPVSAEKFL